MNDDMRKQALDYHMLPSPGKISVVPTKKVSNQNDLSLCYTPGVAVPVMEIAKNSDLAYDYTSKSNLIGIITNGTAVLGLGNVGALASKPVMEGKSNLFKVFADVDSFDIEVNCDDVDDFIGTVTNISPTFGGINLEDIKAPECFYIEEQLKSSLNIPVMHDDQHGTAIVVAAGLLNALHLQNKTLDSSKIVCVGAGAAGIATMSLLIKLGARQDNLFLVDSKGVIHTKRHDLNKYKMALANTTHVRTLQEAIDGADVFIGVSGPGVVDKAMIKSMAEKPTIFALSNPTPEISPEEIKSVRSDAVIATGRSDYPNQVNNALCFPYIFRGALDARATCINYEMQMAAVHAIKDLARQDVPLEILQAYELEKLEFGFDYILPKLLDKRLKESVSKAVYKAYLDSRSDTDNSVNKN